MKRKTFNELLGAANEVLEHVRATKDDCAHAGHYWVEENDEPFVRHRGRPQGLVPVMCVVCGTTTELEGHSPHTAPPQRSTDPGSMSAH